MKTRNDWWISAEVISHTRRESPKKLRSEDMAVYGFLLPFEADPTENVTMPAGAKWGNVSSLCRDLAAVSCRCGLVLQVIEKKKHEKQWQSRVGSSAQV